MGGVVASSEPATTGIVTASATASHSVSFSASLIVGASPVVPAMTRPSLPWSWSQRARATAPSTSSDPSSVNGVTIAVATRPKRAMAVRLVLRRPAGREQIGDGRAANFTAASGDGR